MKIAYELRAGAAVIATTAFAGAAAHGVVDMYNGVNAEHDRAVAAQQAQAVDRPQARGHHDPINPWILTIIAGSMTLAASIGGAYVLAPEDEPPTSSEDFLN